MRAGSIVLLLALAVTLIFGPAQITAVAADLNSAPATDQHQHEHHHDNQANADHGSSGAAQPGHHSASIKVYCTAATPGHANHTQHGNNMCEGYRVMSSMLTLADGEMARYCVRLGAQIAPDRRPPSHSPESLKEPPRTT